MPQEAPQYQVIYKAILKKIRKGSFTREAAIPSENELAQKYSVSRMTARKSIDMLVNEGYLIRQKGKGTFITGRKRSLKDEISLSLRLKNEGMRVYSEVLSVELLPNQPMQVREALGLTEESAWKTERKRYADDLFFLYEESYIPERLIRNITETDIPQSLTEFISQIMEPGELETTCEAYLLNKKEAKIMDLKKDTPVLKVSSTLRAMDGTPLIYSEGLQITGVIPFRSRTVK